MNSFEFNQCIGHVIARAVNEGIPNKKISVPEIIGVLEMHQGELMRWSQDMARQKSQSPIILPPLKG